LLRSLCHVPAQTPHLAYLLCGCLTLTLAFPLCPCPSQPALLRSRQDCIQSMNPQTCRYTDPNRLCYTLPGQGWCAEAANAGHPGCKDLGAEVTAANLNGPGTWAVRAPFCCSRRNHCPADSRSNQKQGARGATVPRTEPCVNDIMTYLRVLCSLWWKCQCGVQRLPRRPRQRTLAIASKNAPITPDQTRLKNTFALGAWPSRLA
jgi:hypothetical protein